MPMFPPFASRLGMGGGMPPGAGMGPQQGNPRFAALMQNPMIARLVAQAQQRRQALGNPGGPGGAGIDPRAALAASFERQVAEQGQQAQQAQQNQQRQQAQQDYNNAYQTASQQRAAQMPMAPSRDQPQQPMGQSTPTARAPSAEAGMPVRQAQPQAQTTAKPSSLGGNVNGGIAEELKRRAGRMPAGGGGRMY